MAFTFILGPSEFQQLAQADTLYQNLSTNGWGQTDRTIDYTYDANGSLLSKTTRETSTSTVQERVDYQYNHQGRLSRLITDLDSASGTNPVDVVDYVYNEAGIRVSSYSFTVPQDKLYPENEEDYDSSRKVTYYLIDGQNPTGYAQVIAELVYELSDIAPMPDLASDTPTSIRSYTIGDDMLAQTDDPLGSGTPQYLLYDGHGSTRQVIDINKAILPNGSYSYDAYGMMLGGNPTALSPAATNLLYTGEQYDANLQQYYLRARYYNPSSGTFNRMDDFAGNESDPQSLHKYLYCHANPVNGIDPSGMMVAAMSISNLQLVIAISVLLVATIKVATDKAWQRASEQLAEALIASTVALVAAAGMPFKSGWEKIKETWNRVKEYFKDRGGIYLHYGYRRHWGSFLTLGLLPGKFATTDVYLYGWMAKMFLALPHPEPPNAVYVIWPKKGFGPTWSKQVDPDFVTGMPGGGYEYFFAKGSGGVGTAFGIVSQP